MTVSPTVSETHDSAADLIALQSKTLMLAHVSLFFYFLLNWFLDAKILFAETPSPLFPLSEVAEELEAPQAHSVSVKHKKLAGNL